MRKEGRAEHPNLRWTANTGLDSQGCFLVEGAHSTMFFLKRLIAIVLTSVAVLGHLTPAVAETAGLGQPYPWQIGFQAAASPVMNDINWFHDFLLWIITAISLFVLALLV